MAAASAAGFVPAAAHAAPAGTICVGLVLDAHAIGGRVTDTCVNVKPGTTGVGVLEAAGHSVTFRQDGLLCTIDGVPDTGCSKVDNTHYWAYYHRAPDHTTWSYSVQDSRTYQPANRSTEGWVYDDGSSLKPANIPAAKICAGLVKPAPSPSPTRTASRHPAHHPRAATPTGAASSTPSSPTATTPRKAQHARSGDSRARTSTGRPADRSVTPSPGARTSADAAASASTASLANGTSSGSGGHGSAVGAVVAAAVVAVLAAATVIGARRRRR